MNLAKGVHEDVRTSSETKNVEWVKPIASAEGISEKLDVDVKKPRKCSQT